MPRNFLLFPVAGYGIVEKEYAGMMKLVDMRDLGSRAAMRWGSSPHARTRNSPRLWTPLHSQGLFSLHLIVHAHTAVFAAVCA